MNSTRHVTMSTSAPTTLMEAIGFVLEQFDEESGPLYGAEMPSFTARQILQPAAADEDWKSIWEVSVTGSFPRLEAAT